MSLGRISSGASWMRGIAIGSCLALGLSAFGGGSAGAAMTPAAVGSLTCGITGTAAAKPGIPGTGLTPTTRWTMLQIHQNPLASCNTAGVTGGKASITGGELKLNARVNPGASCDALVSSLSSVNKAVVGVKLTHTNTTVDPITGAVTGTQTFTVALVRAKLDPTNIVASGGGIHITGTLQQSASGNKPFGGETLDVQLNLGADCAAAPVASIDLTGSSLSIH
jgi:hypothetical protein